MKTTKQYETEKKVVKGVFWTTLMAHVGIYYLLPYLNYDICSNVLLSFCKNFYYIKFYYLTLIFVFLSFVFIFNKNNFVKWRKVLCFITVATIVNLLRGETYNDYFAIGYMPVAIYIYIIGFIWSTVVALRNRKQTNKR